VISDCIITVSLIGDTGRAFRVAIFHDVVDSSSCCAITVLLVLLLCNTDRGLPRFPPLAMAASESPQRPYLSDQVITVFMLF